MLWHSAAALLLAATTIEGVLAQVLTITEYASVCSATYTSGSKSVTVVKSTYTVQPVYFTDDDANNGTPFVLEIGTPSGSKKRQSVARVWVKPDGNTTDIGSEAAQYVIRNGVLTTTNGGYISTSAGVATEPFAVSWTAQAIDTQFVVQQGVLTWKNTQFSNGVAGLYQTPAGLVNNAEVIARFSGPVDPSWQSVELGARPVNEAMSGGAWGTSSTSISTAMHVGSMSPAPQTSTSNAQPSSTNIVSPNGVCGASSEYGCAGSEFGDCCSQYGYCGSDDGFCGAGCQSNFGTCWMPSMSSAGPQSTSQGAPGGYSSPGSNPISSATMAMPMSSASATSSTASPYPTFVCPDDDGQVVTDLNGRQYTLGCGRDTTIGAYSSTYVQTSFDECFGLCDAEDDCTAFTYSGGQNGDGAGICYFKNENSEFVNSGDRLVGAILVAPSASSSSSQSVPVSTFTSTAGAIGPLNPPPTASPSVSLSTSPVAAASSVASSPMVMTPGTSMSMSPSLSWATSNAAASPSSTAPVSPNGHCGTQGNGGNANGFICTGSQFGMCCSSSGYCGNTTDYCVAGCQSAYGSCTPQTGNSISTMGECGPSNGNQTCTGSIFGTCCSNSGYCGSTSDYCAAGNCNPMFGTCNASTAMTTMTMSSRSLPTSLPTSSVVVVSSSSVMLSSSISSPAVSVSSPAVQLTSTSATSSMAMSSSTRPSPTATASPSAAPPCPAANVTGYTDTAGNQYVILCDTNTNPGSFAGSAAPNFGACIDACHYQTAAACNSVTYLGGTCYFKSSYSGSLSAPGVEAAVLASVLGVTPGTYSASSSAVMASTSSAVSSTTSPSSTVVSYSSSHTWTGTWTGSWSGSWTGSGTWSSSQSTSSALSTSSAASSPPVTTTTTTSSPSQSSFVSSSSTSTSTSSSAYLVLPSPTACSFGDPPNTDEDDSYCEIVTPFNMQMYGQSSPNTYPSTNGYISILQGSSQYQAMQLPASNIPNNTVAPFFDDLYLYGTSGPQEGIFYQYNSAQTAITYEFYLSRAGQQNMEVFHFTVKYDSTQPGIFVYTYYSVGGANDDGLYAAVGTQGRESSLCTLPCKCNG